MPIGKGEDLASWEDAIWETSLSGWEIALSTLGVLSACLEELLEALPAWELLLGETCEALSLAEHLTTRNAWGRTTLSAWEKVLSVGEAWELPAWETALSAWERVLSTGEAWELPAWELPASGTTFSAWERVLSTKEAWELPAWEIVLSAGGKSTVCLGSLRGSPRSYWPACLRTVSWLWGPNGQHYLPVICPGEGPSRQENLRALPSYTSFLFIYQIIKFSDLSSSNLGESCLLGFLYKFLALLVAWGW